jgi:RNA polymerase sigma-70 factor (ECF subfamily)
VSCPVSTCWSLIGGAAAGDSADRAEFARRYAPVIKAYLEARWRHSIHREELEDAVQEVFIDCFKQNGALERVDRGRRGGFRGFLYGVTRNIGMRFESAKTRHKEHQPSASFDLNAIEQRERSLTRSFDRAWAQSVMREALVELQLDADADGEEAMKRFELLSLRFRDGLPIHEIASRWQVGVTQMYREFAKAKVEFRDALLAIVATQQPDASRDEVAQECMQLLDLLE